jgi:hypothetical protein
MMTVSAAIKFNPKPPALVESRNTFTVWSSLNLKPNQGHESDEVFTQE